MIHENRSVNVENLNFTVMWHHIIAMIRRENFSQVLDWITNYKAHWLNSTPILGTRGTCFIASKTLSWLPRPSQVSYLHTAPWKVEGRHLLGRLLWMRRLHCSSEFSRTFEELLLSILVITAGNGSTFALGNTHIPSRDPSPAISSPRKRGCCRFLHLKITSVGSQADFTFCSYILYSIPWPRL